MIKKFLQDNENKEIRLVWGFDEFTGILKFVDSRKLGLQSVYNL
jgi:hypothetical protein